MTFWKTCILATALTGAAGVGAAMAPAVHGQSSTRVVPPRAVEVFTSGGGRIGVTIADLDPTGAKGSGVLVDEVETDGPAAKAGLRKGDVVVEFDGERVRSVRQFTRLVNETPVGRQVAAAVTRDGQRVSVNITPRETNAFSVFDDSAWRALESVRGYARALPAPPKPPAVPKVAPRAPSLDGLVWISGTQLGVTVNTLSDQLKEYFATKGGVLVVSVAENSTAAKAGVKAGDIILSINGDNVEEPGDIRRRAQRLEIGDEVTLNIVRDRKPLTLKGKVEEGRSRRLTRTIL